MIRHAPWRPLAAALLFVVSIGAVRAQGQAACQAPDRVLPAAAVERWLGQHASPNVLLEAMARAAASPLWIDEIAISAGRALVKGHVDGSGRAVELQAFLRRLQQQGESVRRAPNATWLDDKGLPTAVDSTPSFLLQLEGVPQAGRAAGRSAVTCDLADKLLGQIMVLPVMGGTQMTLFKPRREPALEADLPVLSIDVTVSGRFIDLVNLLRAWESLPFAITLDGLVMAPEGEQLQMALTIKVLRGTARTDGNLAGGARTGALQDPFRRSEKVLADRHASSPLPACSQRAQAWASQASKVSYQGRVDMYGSSPMGFFRFEAGGVLRSAREGEAIVDIGARVISVAHAAAEIEVAEQVGDTCQLRTVRLSAQAR